MHIHADARPAASARAIGAAAYTSGQNIVFDSQRYQPQTSAGRQLLGHELTHVLQQAQGASVGVVRHLYVGAPEEETVNSKKFTAKEYQWSGDVWNLREIEMLFTVYGAVPDPVLHRVNSLGGSEGSTRWGRIHCRTHLTKSRDLCR